jgi:hypothetical protein
MLRGAHAYAVCAADESATLPRASRPFSDQGKCATGMTKKLVRVST